MSPPNQDALLLSNWMLKEHGPLLGGKALHAALGFRTYAAFHRAYQKGEIGVRIFVLPRRRGLFALTTDVACWLEAQANGREQSAKKEPTMSE